MRTNNYVSSFSIQYIWRCIVSIALSDPAPPGIGLIAIAIAENAYLTYSVSIYVIHFESFKTKI